MQCTIYMVHNISSVKNRKFIQYGSRYIVHNMI